MKELANSFAELAAIIMLLITLAVSTAVISQWGGPDGSGSSSAAAPSTQRAMPLSLDAR